MTLTSEQYRSARLARDARFDGRFFIAVKTTGIYCRPVCPATPPKEENVVYFQSATQAAEQGFRPCLRCRPESAPGSWAWKGTDTTFERAVRLIDQGALATGSVPALAERLGISDRYLRRLFVERTGLAPKQYGEYQQLLFAKKLLHESRMPIADVAFASGFNSVRRFNDSFSKHFSLTPGTIRKTADAEKGAINLLLYYRPPFDWERMRSFLQKRMINEMEWVGEQHYGRTISWGSGRITGRFTATHLPEKNAFNVELQISDPPALFAVVKNIRRVLDLDADSEVIDGHLLPLLGDHYVTGLRLPGIWSVYEAGIRAVLGQQVSVETARRLVQQLVDHLGKDGVFPEPSGVADSDLEFLKIPASRKQTLRDLSSWFHAEENAEDPLSWKPVKGIGPWTIDYARMRGLSEPDVWLGTDLGVKKIIGKSPELTAENIQAASPWRSYLTFQCWSQL